MKKMFQKLRIRAVPLILSVALILTGIFSVRSIVNLQGNARVINYTGIVRGATQRLIKKELSRVPDDELIAKLDRILDGLSNGSEEFDLIRLESPEYQALLVQMREEWAKIKTEIERYRNGQAGDTLFLRSEAYFNLADETVLAAEEYTEQCVLETRRVLLYMNAAFVLLAVLSGIFASIQEKKRKKLQEAEEENRKRSEQLSLLFQEIRAPMNEISELVYVSDIDTYDLLFVNNAGKETFHIDDKDHPKCYQALQGLDAPCPFCTIPYTKVGENYTWEHTNPLTKRHYILKDRLIEWEGRLARMEIAFDMTESENKKNELESRLERDKILVECIRELYRNHNTQEAISCVLGQVGPLFSADRAYLFTTQGDYIFNTAEWCKEGVKPEKDNLQNLLKEDFKHWFDLFEIQENVIIDDVEKLNGVMQTEYDTLQRQDIQRVVLVPMEREGNLDGFVGLDNLPGDLLENAASFLQTLRYFLMLAISRNEDEEKLSRMSYQDSLTSFYNRNRYMQDVEELSGFEGPVGIVYLDVNGLKEVNDRFGHDAGDKLLKDFALALRDGLRIGTYYRIGGDEFVVICTGVSEDEFTARVHAMRVNLQKEGIETAVGLQWTDECENIRRIITMADENMYADKKDFYHNHKPTGRYRHHNDLFQELADPAVLKKRIAEKRFVVFLQPKIDVTSRKAVGAEALIRYREESGHIGTPDQFIPLLEEARTIDQLDFYSFAAVCSQLKEWKEQGKKLLPISSNFSRCSFQKPSFADKLSEICRRFEVPKELVEIEVTESTAGIDFQELNLQIDAVRRAGFRVSVDDFGMEASNLALLATNTFDVLKIDKSFVTDIVANQNAQTIVESMAGVCEKLNIRLVAEGVEKEEQLALLKACGIQVVQGFLFSRPIPIEEYEKRYLQDD